jgi:hypothetical protein
MGKYFRPDASSGRLDGQLTSFFVSFPTTPISSKSDIWVKSYDQNTGGRPDGLTERPNGQLQPPFQNSTESSHNKATSRRCCPSVRTVSLWLHEITIIRPWSVRTIREMSGRLNWCTQFPYMKLDRPDHKIAVRTVELCTHVLPYGEHRLDKITHRPDGSSRLPITMSWGRNPNSCQTLNGVRTV